MYIYIISYLAGQDKTSRSAKKIKINQKAFSFFFQPYQFGPMNDNNPLGKPLDCGRTTTVTATPQYKPQDMNAE